MPIQRVLRKLAAVPHFFQLRLFVRPTSLALHVYVNVHGFSLRSGRNRERSKVRFGFKSRFGRLDSQICARIVDPASSVSANSATPGIGIGAKGYGIRRKLKLSCCRVRCPERRKRSAGDSGRYSRSRGCKLRGDPKISRKMIASRKPDFDASKVAMSVFNSAPFAIGRVAAA